MEYAKITPPLPRVPERRLTPAPEPRRRGRACSDCEGETALDRGGWAHHGVGDPVGCLRSLPPPWTCTRARYSQALALGIRRPFLIVLVESTLFGQITISLEISILTASAAPMRRRLPQGCSPGGEGAGEGGGRVSRNAIAIWSRSDRGSKILGLETGGSSA